MKNEINRNVTRFIVRAGIFSAFSVILYLLLKFPVPFFPAFLKFHFDEIPAFIASFAYGPLMGIVVLFVKTIIALPFTDSLCVGELIDLVYSLVFIIPAAIIYQKRRKFSSVIIGFSLGLVLQLVASLIMTIYVMIPFYETVMGFSEGQILAMAQAANSNIKDVYWGLGLAGILPFNLIKDVLVIAVTLPTYKSLHKLMDKIQ